METEQLRKADFKTGVFLIAFCLWYLAITFAFMPFKETYGGVENVWYVSPWIFPAVILTLLLILSSILTINAVLNQGLGDVVIFRDNRLRSFQLTRIGVIMNAMLVVASGAGLVYLIINIEEKIQFTIDESQWLAVPSQANIFSWSNPLAMIPLLATSLVFIASSALLASLLWQRQRVIRLPTSTVSPAIRETRARFIIIAVLFSLLVYVLVPNLDFFVAILLFLSVFITCFYVEDDAVARLSMSIYVALGTVVLLIFATGVDSLLNAVFPGAVDLLVLGATLIYSLLVWHRLAGNTQARKKFRTGLLLSWITPLLLVPIFRFGLLVPLPHEGAVIELMHQLRYLLR